MMHSDVLIVGAGPTGLVLALWLTRLGVKVRIIAKTAELGTTSRALAVQARTLELYRQLDLTDAVLKLGHKAATRSSLAVRGWKNCFANSDYGRTGPNKRARWCRNSVSRCRLRFTAELIERDTKGECSDESGGKTGFTIFFIRGIGYSA